MEFADGPFIKTNFRIMYISSLLVVEFQDFRLGEPANSICIMNYHDIPTRRGIGYKGMVDSQDTSSST